jgi:protease-4
MNLPRIFERFYRAPLAITRERMLSIHSVLFPRVVSGADFSLEMLAFSGEMGDSRPNQSFDGRRAQKCRPSYLETGAFDSRLYYTAKPGVAVVPVYGVLAKNLSAFEESCGGGTDTSPIGRALAQASENPKIRAIILDIDSPGGEVTGTPELAAKVRAVAGRMPVYAFSDAGTYSAAYWIASGASEIYSTPSARWGSIGVRAAFLDETVAMQMAGLKLETFVSGKHKAMGAPFRGLTDDERAMIQAMVDDMGVAFRGDVIAGRPSADLEAMEGQTFSAGEAIERGIVDGLVDDWEALVAMV